MRMKNEKLRINNEGLRIRNEELGMRKCFLIVFFLLIGVNIFAQGFGFGDEDGGAGSGFSVSVNGEVSAKLLGYFDEFYEGAEFVRFGDIFSGSLGFSAQTSVAEGVINLNLDTTTPVSIDEAYLRAFFGNFEITAGLRKLVWGRADSMGPLDVINPLDTSLIYTEMSDSTSLLGVKIARPLVHAAFRFGQSSKVEAVFVPWFEPHLIPGVGERWRPAQMDQMKGTTITMPVPLPPPYPSQSADIFVKPNLLEPPDTTTLDYAQAGLRFTTTIGQADFGLQYYYGWLPQPSVKINDVRVNVTPNLDIPSPVPIPSSVDVDVDISYLYNPYHQIGLDYGQVLFGVLNIRAELAANITEDLEGDDGSVYNPSLAWSLGFDRDLFFGININMQVNESIRLFHDKLGDDMTTMMDNLSEGVATGAVSLDTIDSQISRIDIEGGSSLTSTRLTVALSKKFLRDQLELRTAVVWGIEDMDCAIMPALIWTKEELRIALSCGFFAGNEEGQLGQYKDNNFIKLALTYVF